MTDWKEKRIDALIKSAETSIQRARSVFMIVTIVGVTLLVANFNGNIPLVRHSVYQDACNDERTACTEELKKQGKCDLSELEKWCSSPPKEVSLKKESDDRNTRSLIWEKELSILDAPMLGLKIHSWDVNFIGSVAMSILALWYYFSVRRENHVINEVLKVCTDIIKQANSVEEIRIIHYVFSSISHQFVFMIRDQSGENLKLPYVLCYTTVLAFMPFWVPLTTVFLDCLTFFTPDHYLRWYPQALSGWNKYDSYMATEFLFRELVALIFVVYNYKTCKEIKRLQNDAKLKMSELAQLKEQPITLKVDN